MFICKNTLIHPPNFSKNQLFASLTKESYTIETFLQIFCALFLIQNDTRNFVFLTTLYGYYCV